MPYTKKPKPTALHKLNGNPGKRALNYDEPQPPMMTAADIPPELDGNRVAMREWVRLVPMLRACKQITEADRAALISLCLEWSRYLELQAGNTVRDFIERRHALNSCLRLWPELGLTPSSRSRVKIADNAALSGGDRFSEFDAETSGTH